MVVDSILDIGAGTGLLSLMLAQQSAAHIDAIELDEHASEQAAENFEASEWKQRLQTITADARTVHLGKKYDLIISNPPFFENDLKSGNTQRNLALHSQELNLTELLTLISKHISDTGKFAVLLPYHRKQEFEKLAIDAGFYLEESISVKQTPNHDFFRVLFLFGRTEVASIESEMYIRNEDQYGERFTELLRDYYLKL
jgi:tRNA1Val (adenine37-N6)-methyltransferase